MLEDIQRVVQIVLDINGRCWHNLFMKRNRTALKAAEIVEFLNSGDKSSWYFGLRWNGCEYSVCDGKNVSRACQNSVDSLIRKGSLVRAAGRNGWVLA